MELDISRVEYSRKDILNKTKIPIKLDEDLSYFLGIHVGDGSMNNYGKYWYSMSYSGHLKDEYLFYTKSFYRLFKKLFNKDLNIYEDLRKNRTSIKLSTHSKAIYFFLSKVIKLQSGPKTMLSIPEIVKNSNFVKAFLKGLADADFSLTFKKRTYKTHCYPVICFYSNNKILIKEASGLLRKFGFKICNVFDLSSKRYEKTYITNVLQISGKKQLEKWMEEIGFSSRKHLTKYLVWKKYGFCPPFTSLLEREEMLNKNIA